tara:strand:+ start:242562 stop:243359 length:798 start_codon:yes stop_codon:yes gene_type:complete
MDCLDEQLKAYVFPEDSQDENSWRNARDKFGDISPIRDGKLGEMLLYVFVEAFLKTPLMAYKLKDLGNPNDQVKGADGVFVGEYQGKRALLIGESKVHRKLAPAITSTFRSLQRFHDEAGPYSTELLVSRKYPKERGLSSEYLEAAIAILNEGYEVLVHPIFVSYSMAEIATISGVAMTQEDAESALSNHVEAELVLWEKKIADQVAAYPKPFQVYLDFFFLPAEDSLQLREHFYEMLHGHPYESRAVREALKKIKKATSKGNGK